MAGDHKLPLTFERQVKGVFSSETGRLLHLEIRVELIADGRIDLKVGERVKVNIEKWKP